MKSWPKDPTETTPCPLVGVERAYHRSLLGLPHEYSGMDIGEAEKAICLSPNDVFEAIAKDPHDAFERVSYLCLQIGIEQGRRMHRRDLMPVLLLLLRQAYTAGADVSWMQGQYTEETGDPWPFMAGFEAAERDDLGDHASLSL